MPGSDWAHRILYSRFGGRELLLRVCSAVVLAPLALTAAYIGGWPFALFWALAAVGVFWEWVSLMIESRARALLVTGIGSVALTAALAQAGHVRAAVALLATGAFALIGLAPNGRRLWLAAGLLYAGSLAVAPIVLRSDLELGFLTIILLFAIVWSTDITAYFLGRAIGGPKLMRSVSPHKTWSGALSGAGAAIVSALVVAAVGGLTDTFQVAMLACVLSVSAQAGDLLESALKRTFGAKDSSSLIPGHGGLMDRLDGFVVASFVAAVIGAARGGVEAPGRGLLVW